MSKLVLSRRTLLRGALGTGIAIALPPLEAMVTDKSARAATPGKRFMTFFMGNGVPTLGYCHDSAAKTCTERWLPPNLGAGFTLSEAMQPLAPVKKFVRVMSGLRNPHYDNTSHTANMSGVMTGMPMAAAASERALGGPTIDFIAAKTLSQGCRFKQLSVLLAGANYNAISRNTITFGDGGAPVAPTRQPIDLFNRLFQGYTPPVAGMPPPVDPEAVRRKNILDFVREDAKTLNQQLGATDRARLDQHLTAIEEVQRSLMPGGGVATDSCKVPGAPPTSTDLRTKSRQLLDLVALAFACDMTRVVGFSLVGCNAENTLPWLYPGNLHDECSHAKVIDQPTVLERMAKIVAWQLGELAYLVGKLQAIKEDGGSVFDSTLIVTASEHGNSNNHSATDIPLVAVGGAKTGLVGDFHWRAPGAPTPSTANEARFSVTTSRMWLSVLQLLGINATSFGSGETSTIPLK